MNLIPKIQFSLLYSVSLVSLSFLYSSRVFLILSAFSSSFPQPSFSHSFLHFSLLHSSSLVSLPYSFSFIFLIHSFFSLLSFLPLFFQPSLPPSLISSAFSIPHSFFPSFLQSCLNSSIIHSSLPVFFCHIFLQSLHDTVL